MKIKLFLLCFALTAGACHSNKDNFSKAAQPTEKTAAPAPQNYSTLDMELQSSAKPMPGMPVTRYVPPAVKKDEDLKRRLKEEEIALDDALTEPVSGESYNPVVENPFQDAHKANISTFSIDVDAASYANVRRFLNEGMLPPADAVRIEEMINYFDYQYNAPRAQHPFDVYTEAAPCPWEPKHRVLLIGLQGKTVDTGQLPASNLVFLMDVSGSMDAPNKLPLVQQSLSLLTDQLRPNDRVAIVVYAGAAGLVLESTPGTEKAKIKAAIGDLHAGGSTAGGEGIRLAYATARKHFIPNGNNRVVLCTDGDFNVGTSSEQELINLIEKERLRLVPHATKSVDGKNIANAGHREAGEGGGDAFTSPDDDERPSGKPIGDKVRLPIGKRPPRSSAGGDDWEVDNEAMEDSGYEKRKFEDDEE